MCVCVLQVLFLKCGEVKILTHIKWKKKRRRRRSGEANFFVACPHLPTNYTGTEFSLGLLSACLKFIDVYIHSCACVFVLKKLNLGTSFNIRFFAARSLCFFESWMNYWLSDLLLAKNIHIIRIMPHKT